MNDTGQVLTAFALTLAAGLSTGIGSLVALLAKRESRRFLSVSLGFSAGVMVYVSMVELLSTARASLEAQLGARGGAWAAVGAFFGGILLIAVIDRLIPSEENPHEARAAEEGEAEPRALIGFAGPRVIEQPIRQKLPEGFQRAEFQLERGFIDAICDRRSQRDTLIQLLRLHGYGPRAGKEAAACRHTTE